MDTFTYKVIAISIAVGIQLVFRWVRTLMREEAAAREEAARPRPPIVPSS